MLPLFIPWFRLDGIPIPGLPQQISIQPFGLLVVIGVMLGARTAERRARRLGIAPDVIAEFIAYVVVIGFVLGHVFDRLAYDPEVVWQDPLDLLMPWRSLSSFGGFFGAVIGACVWKWRAARASPSRSTKSRSGCRSDGCSVAAVASSCTIIPGA